MPSLNSRTDTGWRELQDRLAAAIAPFANEFGSRECEHGDWLECEANNGDGCDYTSTRPTPGSMAVITEWVLVVNASDMSGDNDDATVMVGSPGSGNTRIKGMLHVALYE